MTHVKGHWRNVNGKRVWVRPHERVSPSATLRPGETSPIVPREKINEKHLPRMLKKKDALELALDRLILRGVPEDRIADMMWDYGASDVRGENGVYRIQVGWGKDSWSWFYHPLPESYPERQRASWAAKFFSKKGKMLREAFPSPPPDDFDQHAGWLAANLGVTKNRRIIVNHRYAIDAMIDGLSLGKRMVIPEMDVLHGVDLPEVYRAVGYGLRWGVRTGRVLSDRNGELVSPKTHKRLNNFEFVGLLARIGSQLAASGEYTDAAVMRAYQEAWK